MFNAKVKLVRLIISRSVAGSDKKKRLFSIDILQFLLFLSVRRLLFTLDRGSTAELLLDEWWVINLVNSPEPEN